MTPAEALPAVAVHVCAPRPNSALLRIVGEARTAFSTWAAKLYPPPADAGPAGAGRGRAPGRDHLAAARTSSRCCGAAELTPRVQRADRARG